MHYFYTFVFFFTFFLALVAFIDSGERQEGDRENGEDMRQKADELGVELATSRTRSVASIHGPPALTTAPPGWPPISIHL